MLLNPNSTLSILPDIFKLLTVPFSLFLPHCAPHQTIVKHLRENRLTQRCLRFNYTMHFQTSVGFHNKLFKKKAINFELNIHFHNYLKKKSNFSSEGKRQWSMWNNAGSLFTLLLTLFLGGCMYALSLSRRSCAVSIRYWEERIRTSSTGPATGHDAFIREPVCQGKREEREDGRWVTVQTVFFLCI